MSDGATGIGLDVKSDIPHHRVEDVDAFEAAYSVGIKLGQGSFGTVRLVEHKETQVTYACKIMRKRRGMPTAYEQIQREVAIMKRVRHPHIVQLYEVYETPKKFFLIMENCKGGELVQRIKSRRPLSEADVCSIMRRLVDAVAYLHDQGIVHRDIKPENVLVSTAVSADATSGPVPLPVPGAAPVELLNIKVSDFGLATFVDSCTMMENIVGTPFYMAPEIVQNLGYSATCDIWSLGVMLYLMLCGYRYEVEKALQQMISEGRIEYPALYWNEISPGARNLVESTLKIDPANRITAREILMHPWLNGEATSTQSTATVLDLMRSYNTERRFRSVCTAVMAFNRFRTLNGVLQTFSPTLSESSSSKTRHSTAGLASASHLSISDVSASSSRNSLVDDDYGLTSSAANALPVLGSTVVALSANKDSIKNVPHVRSLVYIKTGSGRRTTSSDRNKSIVSLTGSGSSSAGGSSSKTGSGGSGIGSLVVGTSSSSILPNDGDGASPSSRPSRLGSTERSRSIQDSLHAKPPHPLSTSSATSTTSSSPSSSSSYKRGGSTNPSTTAPSMISSASGTFSSKEASARRSTPDSLLTPKSHNYLKKRVPQPVTPKRANTYGPSSGGSVAASTLPRALAGSASQLSTVKAAAPRRRKDDDSAEVLRIGQLQS